MASFIRFTLLRHDIDSGRKQGILTSAADFCDEEEISNDEHRRIRTALDWFDSELTVPEILERPGYRRAISWFKSEATEAISRMWELKAILDHHDLNVEIQKTQDPGTVVYEDDWQLVAIPRKWQNIS